MAYIAHCVILVAKFCPILKRPHGLQPTRLLCPWDFPGKNTGVGYHFLFQDIPGSGRSPGEGNGNPLQYSSLENPMDQEAWQATGHGVTKCLTRLHFHFHFGAINSKNKLQIDLVRLIRKKCKRKQNLIKDIIQT